MCVCHPEASQAFRLTDTKGEAQAIMQTAKQLKRIQEKDESILRLGRPVIAYWSYKHNEQEHFCSAPATIYERGKDYIRVSLDKDYFDDEHRLLYNAEYVIWIPKTNNADWNVNNRFEKVK